MNHSFARLDEAYDPPGDLGQQTPPRSRSQSYESDETYIIGGTRSPSVLSDVSSPLSSLDTDDYDSDRGSVKPHEFRSPERTPDHLIQKPLQNKRTPSKNTVQKTIEHETDPAVMKHILRIQKDLQKIIKDDTNETDIQEFPFVEMGLFVSVGLFVLLAMNMMLQMGKQHVTYRFSSFD